MKVSSLRIKIKKTKMILNALKLIRTFKETVKVYNGEGGIPLKGSKFEDFTFPNFKI
jgi:hypothetical protein